MKSSVGQHHGNITENGTWCVKNNIFIELALECFTLISCMLGFVRNINLCLTGDPINGRRHKAKLRH